VNKRQRPLTAKPTAGEFKSDFFSKREIDFIKKKDLKSYAEIECNLWKNNISFAPRQNKNWLDITDVDFSLQQTTSISGTKEAPSTFNIFRDSLKMTSE